MRVRRWLTGTVLAIALLTERALAAEHSGRVSFNQLPVPGARVVATNGTTTHSTVSGADGTYRFVELAEGEWRVRVEMTGFEPAAATVNAGPPAARREWVLVLLPFAQIRTTPPPPAVAAVTEPTAQNARGAVANAPPQTAAAASMPVAVVSPAGDPATADSYLLNGSVNNSAASLFAQMAAFGNNRRGGRSLYNGGLQTVFGSSAFDSRPFSFSSERAAKPSYNNSQILGTFGGPLRIPRVLRNGPNLFVGVQHALDNSAASQNARVPTAAERRGDFSQSVDGLGRPVVPIDPLTGQPFPNRQIPAARIAPQANALLGLYPSTAGDTFQTPTIAATRQTNVQVRANQVLGRRDSVFGTLLMARGRNENRDFFGFTNSARSSTSSAAVNWQRRVSQFMSLRVGYEGSAQANAMNPFFAGRSNVSGDAGIVGNDQQPENWGPPSLTFGSGLATLATPAYSDNHGRTDTVTGEVYRGVGRHNLTIGGATGLQRLDIFSQQDARGSFAFTGAATGSDVADLLLGLPATASIAYGNADKFLSGALASAYVNDDWRVSSSLTVNAGVRWEYESPFTERDGRLANLDVTRDFSVVHPVVSGDTTGSVSGASIPRALMQRDLRGLQPRVGAAWRPVAGSSLVLRGGYGVYRNSGVYQSVSLLLAQQAPFSNSVNLTSTAANPLTLASAFSDVARVSTNTFGIDPDFRVGYAHNWQLSAQRDLPASLTVLGTYLGTAGRHLIQQFLPNTYPIGASNPCPTCTSGFAYLTSNGTSLRNAGQVQLRRRLRNGLMASVQYTLSKSTDNASAFVPSGNPLEAGATVNATAGGSSGLAGASIAQDWRDLEAERGRSVFDRRHQVAVQVQYTTGMGLTSGARGSGLRAALLNGWTMTADVSAMSGAPLTPSVVTPVGGAGVVGTVRASRTGLALDAPSGLYLNPLAYSAPIAGQWGNAGRNSVSGPSEFVVNAGVSRSFLWGERSTAEWRLDATNVLNQVNYAGVNSIVGNPQFGLPTRANTMRRIRASFRVRF